MEVIPPPVKKPFSQWLKEHLVIWKKWIDDHFSKEELTSVRTTFEIDLMLGLAAGYQSFQTLGFTRAAIIALGTAVISAVMRSLWKAIKTLCNIYWNRLAK